jgi:hypothetical protein
MKIHNIEKEVTQDMEHIKNKWNRNAKQNGKPVQQARTSSDRIPDMKMKW